MVRTPLFHCRGPGSIHGRGAKVPRATRCSQNGKGGGSVARGVEPSAVRMPRVRVQAGHLGAAPPPGPASAPPWNWGGPGASGHQASMLFIVTCRRVAGSNTRNDTCFPRGTSAPQAGSRLRSLDAPLRVTMLRILSWAVTLEPLWPHEEGSRPAQRETSLHCKPPVCSPVGDSLCEWRKPITVGRGQAPALWPVVRYHSSPVCPPGDPAWVWGSGVNSVAAVSPATPWTPGQGRW